jgi:hypothetical protein
MQLRFYRVFALLIKNMNIDERIHRCKYLNTKNIYIYKRMNPISQKYDWILSITRKANEEDVAENCIYENVGDQVWRFETKISYCPYCGEKLNEAKNINCLEDSNTKIIDSSEWKSRIL